MLCNVFHSIFPTLVSRGIRLGRGECRVAEATLALLWCIDAELFKMGTAMFKPVSRIVKCLMARILRQEVEGALQRSRGACIVPSRRSVRVGTQCGRALGGGEPRKTTG